MVDSTESAAPRKRRRAKTNAQRTRAWRARSSQRENASAVLPNVRAEVRHSAVTPAVASAVTAGVTANVTPNVTANVTPNVTASVTPDVTANVIPDVTANVAPVVTANATPVVTADLTPNVTPVVTANVDPDVTTNVTPDVTANVDPDVTANVTPVVTANATPVVTASHRRVTLWGAIRSCLLTVAALVLGGAGITISASFGQSLGSSDVAGYLYLAVGVAADLIVFAVPPTSVQLWQARRRTAASVSWMVWLVAFVYVVQAGIGFASDNLAKVKLERASLAPTVTRTAETLRAAEASRVRECRSSAGRFCREREKDERDRRLEYNNAASLAESSADPQTEATIKIVAWITAGRLKPTADDFIMFRFVLLALFPPVGGLLLMIISSREEEQR